MQNSKKKKAPIQEVKKPTLRGSWHGKDAYQRGFRLMLSILALTLLFLLLGLLLSFDSLVVRIIISVAIVGMGGMYMYSQGINQGEKDAALGEIMYERQQEGKPFDKGDLDRCYHPAKGFFEILIAALPFMLFLLVFAIMAEPVAYTLGVLPSWTQGLLRQSEFGDALQYYSLRDGISVMAVMRVVARAFIMPFINVAVLLGDSAVLWMERLSPLLVLIAPIGYGFGYKGGLKARARINTGIAIGDATKKRREQKERRRRARSSGGRNTPERLI